MKKIILILLSLFMLTSCGKKEVVDVDEEETIINLNNYDNVSQEEVSYYEESVTPNNSWSFDGEGTYEYGSPHGMSYKKIISNGPSSLSAYLIPLSNDTYTVTFDTVCAKDTDMRLIISSNTKTYLDEKIAVYSGSRSYTYTFNGSLDYDVSIRFEFNDSIEIDIDRFYLSSNNRRYDSRVNQIGYLSNLEKEVIFTYNPGDFFGVYRKEDDKLVYEGVISELVHDNDADEDVYKALFKDEVGEGEYYIKSEFGDYTYDFKVSSDVYDDLSRDVLHFLYVQRCGSEIIDEYNNLSHDPCHTSESKIYTTLEDTYIDTTGGWHDAGDYGKYLYTTNETIADLLMSILYGESSKELLDEARYGLEFILKLQKSSGSVYNKVVSKEFSEFVSPEYDNEETYVLWAWTESTATFAGCTGLAYLAYKDIDEEFANKCLEAHNKAMDYLYNNQSANNEMNPDGFNVGTYYVSDESDERLFAYSIAYKLSKDEKYLGLISNLINEDTGDEYYGVFSLVNLLDSLDYSSDLYERCKEALRSTANGISDEILSNGYPYPSSSFMNSNGTCARSVTRLLLASRYLKDQRYEVRGAEAINYLLGVNTLDLSFVYEYGVNYPTRIHNRLAVSHGSNSIKGALASGVSALLSDDVLKSMYTDETPVAKRWANNIDSYSCVEPSINNNSSLVLALSLLEYSNNNPLK